MTAGENKTTEECTEENVMGADILTLQELLLRCAGAVYSSGEGTHGYVLSDEMRQTCPCLRAYDGINHYLDATDGYRCCKVFLYDEGEEGPNCLCCQGRSWVPSLDRDAWRQAWRGIGGYINIDSLPHQLGDLIIAQLILPGKGRHQEIFEGRVTEGEGLRGQLAEITAIWRAIDRIPGVKMDRC